MRTGMRRAAFGVVAMALVGAFGLTSCADPARTDTVAAGSAPAETEVTEAAGPVDAMGTAGPTATPSGRPSAKPTVAPSKPPGTKAAAPADNLASRLRTIPASTRQVVVVHSDGFGTSVASLETFEKTGGVWRPKFGVMNARIGSKGFSDNHVEGVATTPTGVYSFGSTMYGVSPDPGLKYAYHRLVADDWWNENPDTPGYNSFFHGADPGGFSEALWQEVPQYNYFAVINYNIPVRTATPARGSGIFLHVAGSGATAGCVSLTQANLLRVLEWLDPAAAPRIVLAPRANLGRY
ncbi:L,D-transpeptidase family protein [Asanoa siamensis]|uniref:L,D-TPase catalytic domain-containing protein n=1 Tax=Asanoa siamensis TaxID=926357 RepID=A0ABQ4D3P0_9ACTN|nr:L,D-transpeptidase family protein [Asanoa siamensis]GIF78154.1 hypothetical protein Asi02nite_76720 [Asanoa siamensis]